jgi:hypothetical protein
VGNVRRTTMSTGKGYGMRNEECRVEEVFCCCRKYCNVKVQIISKLFTVVTFATTDEDQPTRISFNETDRKIHTNLNIFLETKLHHQKHRENTSTHHI